MSSTSNRENVSPHGLDLSNLLLSFKQQNTNRFLDFKELWKLRNFSMIHNGKPTELDEKEYLLALYSYPLGNEAILLFFTTLSSSDTKE